VALLLLAPTASARELQYFDVDADDFRAPLHAPKPPELAVRAGMSVATKAVFLADGTTSAAPMASWDLALLRDYHHAENGSIAGVYLTLARADGSSFFHLKMYEGSPGSGRIATGGALRACMLIDWLIDRPTDRLID
jgi:hypothetical protein